MLSDRKFIIEILQKDSYCDKPLDDDKLNLTDNKGSFIKIRKNLHSICDWSICSRFSDGKYYRFDYLSDAVDSLSKPVHKENIPDDPGGFKYILTFYT